MERYGRRHTNEAEPPGIAVGFSRVMRATGFKRTDAPQAGDIGLVIFEGRMCIALHAGPIWFSRHADGLIGAPLNNIWKTWAV